MYWTNFLLPSKLSERHFEGMSQAKNEVDLLCKFHDYDFRKYKGEQLLNKIARNLVDYEAGKTIFEVYTGIYQQNQVKNGMINFDI